MTAELNLRVGWMAILAGLLFGAAIGLFFHREEWLGGYGSWRRRMLRLAHISLVGTGLLNIAFAMSVDDLRWTLARRAASVLFVAGAAAMPSVCLLSAWRPSFRHLFFAPVLTLVAAAAALVIAGI